MDNVKYQMCEQLLNQAWLALNFSFPPCLRLPFIRRFDLGLTETNLTLHFFFQ